jgi:DNA-directed RNA polymerase beta' subunit
MTISTEQDSNHPQTRSFLFLFPEPNLLPNSDSGLGRQIKDAWDEKFKESQLTFIGLSAESPGFDHKQAEIGGNDYNCNIYAHLVEPSRNQNKSDIFLGSIPYPDKFGEFVLRGNRYYFPIYLRTPKQYEKLQKKLSAKKGNRPEDASSANDLHQQEDERKTDNLRPVLIHELLEQRLKHRLMWVLENLQKRPWNGDLGLLRASLRSWLTKGERSLVHRFVLEYGQLVDRESPLSRILQREELTFHGLGGQNPKSTRGFYLRDIDDDDIYRICPVLTPQGHKVGMRLYLARRSKVDSEKKSIAAPAQPEKGDSLSHAACLIPFIEHDDVSRALMGANMMKQALPLENPEVPWIQTGWEEELAASPEVSQDLKVNGVLSLGKNLLAAYLPWGLETFEDGIVISESAARTLTSKEEKFFWFNQDKKNWQEGDYLSFQITRDNPRIPEENKSCLDNEGIVITGTDVKPGDILVSALLKRFKDINKTRSLDVTISHKFIEPLLKKGPDEVRDFSLRLPHTFKGRVTEIIDSRNTSQTALPSDLVRRIGVRVQRNQAVKVGDKIASRHGAKGVVVHILPDREMPYLKTGNSRCLDDKCLVKEPHRHVQVILNPLGVTGRLNLGQLYETTLAKVAESQNQAIVVKPFQKEWNLDQLSSALSSRGFSTDGKEQLYILEEKIERPLRYRSLVGPQYFLKLHHLAEEKSQVRRIGQPYDYTLRDNQPRVGKRLRKDEIVGSGQRVGEMETWALAGHAAWNLLDDLLNVKSDDRRLLEKVNDPGFNWNESRRPQAFANLILICRSLALNLRLLRSEEDVTENFLEKNKGEAFDRVTLSFAKQEQLMDWGRGGEVSSVDLYAKSKKDRVLPLDKIYPDPEGLYSRKIFDPKKPWQMGLIKLAKPVLHPMMRYFKREYNPDDYMLTYIPVLPTSFRNERMGFYKDFQDDLNVLYRNVIRQNSRAKKLLDEEGTDQTQLDEAQRRLYAAVSNLFLGGYVDGRSRRGIRNIMEGKQGLIRRHLAGKRVDYSGRAVIVGDPVLALDEAGLPDTIWNKLFPGMDKAAKPLILLNRQPSLHRYSVQAFQAVWHERGNVVCLNPFVCRPFNADYDGDTITIHVPCKPEAIKQAEKLLPTRNLLSQANGKMVLGFDKDVAIAAAYLTYDSEIETDEEIPLTSEEELPLNGRDLWEREIFNGIQTTVGRLLLRRLFGDILILNRTLGQDRWMDALEKLTKLAAFEGASILEEFTKGISTLFGQILKKSGLSLSLQGFMSFSDSQESGIPSLLWLMRQTGRYGKDLESQITQKRGQMRRPGREDVLTEPIQSNLLAGHTEQDYFLSAHGARAGLVDKGLITAHSGHLLRDWIYRLQHLYIVQNDCETAHGLDADQVDERQLLHTRFDVNGHLIEKITKGLQFRSPWTCQAQDPAGHPGICKKCYGYDPATGDLPALGLPVGILAAQALGERISQETLKSFHTGGTVQKEKKGLMLVTYLRKAFSKRTKDDSSASTKLHEIFEQFQEAARPCLIHFEVLLKGYKTRDKTTGFLASMAKSQVPSKLVEISIKNSMDDLYGVIARILCGRLIDTGPKGRTNA